MALSLRLTGNIQKHSVGRNYVCLMANPTVRVVENTRL